MDECLTVLENSDYNVSANNNFVFKVTKKNSKLMSHYSFHSVCLCFPIYEKPTLTLTFKYLSSSSSSSRSNLYGTPYK